MKPPKHVHKYMRVVMGGRKVVRIDGIRRIIKSPGTEVFKCQIPGCTTFKLREVVCGEFSVCWKCGSELTLNMENTTLKKPTHRGCRNSRNNEVDPLEGYVA